MTAFILAMEVIFEMITGPGDLRRDNFSKVKGLKRGVVKDLKDPNNSNKIVVTLIDEEIDTPFADVMASFAGEKFGTVFIPSVGEEVVLGFFDGQINNPVILGSLYNSKKKPPLTLADGKNETMMIQFPEGTKEGLKIEIGIAENKQKITLTTKKGHIITLDDGEKQELTVSEKEGKTSFKVDFKEGAIELKAEKKISLTAGENTMVLEDQSGLSVKSKDKDFKVEVNNIVLKAKANAEMSGGQAATVKGSTGATLQSSGNTVVKGQTTSIN